MSNDMPESWSELIQALTLLAKHEHNPVSPLHCEHDTLYVQADPEKFTPAEIQQLDAWGFFPDEEYGSGFASYRYGSA